MERQMQIRMSLLGLVVLSLFAALFARLWYLQVINHEPLVQQVEAVQYRTIPLPAARGKIVDRNGVVLVDNRPAVVLTIDKEVLFEALPTSAERDAMYLQMALQLSAAGQLTKVSDIRDEVDSLRYGPYDKVLLIRDVDQEVAAYFDERFFDFPGVGTESVMVREYPYGTLAAHVLGYVGSITEDELAARENDPGQYGPNDEIGKNGVERSYETQLRGTPGYRRVQVDRTGRIIRVVEEVLPVAGNDLQLTLDVDLQQLTETRLRQGLEAASRQECNDGGPTLLCYDDPRYGAAVIMDPHNGEVLAMASYPTYDPSEFVNGISQAAFDRLNDPASLPLINKVTADAQFPASTIKPFVAYTAMASGLMGTASGVPAGPDAFYVDQGIYKVRGCVFDEAVDPANFRAQCTKTNAGGEFNIMGGIDLNFALARSSDTYFYNLGDAFYWEADPEDLSDGLMEFGFGETTGIGLPGETPGLVLTPELMQRQFEENPGAFFRGDWQPSDSIVMAIGQETVLASPMQLANAYATLANGGTLYTPNIALNVLDPVTGQAVLNYGPRVRREIEMPAAWRDPIIEGLTNAVEYDEGDGIRKGTASKAFANFPKSLFRVAGKTGTAEHQDTSGNQLPENAWFAGFGPLPDSQYVGVSYLAEAGFGGNVAAPVIASIFQSIAEGTVPPAVRVLDTNGEPVLSIANIAEDDILGSISSDAGSR